MPFVNSAGTKLYYEDTGSGVPIIFAHEFGADHRTWEAQVRWFSRYFRCITYNARGYPPSDVPSDETAYSWEHFADDIAAIIRHIGAEQAYVTGLSMGAYAALMFGLRHPAMAKGLVVASGGSGAPPADHAGFRAQSIANAEGFLVKGMATMAHGMATGPGRRRLQEKDQRGGAEFTRYLAEHSPHGMSLVSRNYQGARPSLWDFEKEFAALNVPVLLVMGDEDQAVLEANLFLKRTLPMAGLWMAPRCGHGVNLEEPAAFNANLQEFFLAAEMGRWTGQAACISRVAELAASGKV